MLEFIAILVLVYIAFRLLARLVLPLLLKRYLGKFKQRFYEQNPPHTSQQGTRKGNVSINFGGRKAKTESDNLGEYTDFEEVKEK
ncbi:MAG TPA: hypothetical protein DCM62_10680 [Bacteroidales bacterium]|nr:hypothetical protein [Bacteroidales bacterium]